jgi:hypothetical protein
MRARYSSYSTTGAGGAVYASPRAPPAGAEAKAPPRFELGAKGSLSLPSLFWTGDAGWNQPTMLAFQGAAYACSCFGFSGPLSSGISSLAGYRP